MSLVGGMIVIALLYEYTLRIYRPNEAIQLEAIAIGKNRSIGDLESWRNDEGLMCGFNTPELHYFRIENLHILWQPESNPSYWLKFR